VQKFLAFLRIYESDGMTSDGYAPGRDWAWRTSRLSPFGANAAFVLQQCGAGAYKVGLFVNEQLGKQRENCFFKMLDCPVFLRVSRYHLGGNGT
jgi:hypothetical protein